MPGEAPQPGVPETTNNVQKELKTRNYNVPMKVTKFKQPSAGIKNISVAVMVDGKRVPQIGANGEPVLNKNGEQVLSYEKWSDADLANFSAIVSSAVGMSTVRGDSIVIKNMEFVQRIWQWSVSKEREMRELIRNIVKYISIGVIVACFSLSYVHLFSG